ncbi:MAG: hypothetical protein ACYTGU_05160 [Planctomycetota bacterium]
MKTALSVRLVLVLDDRPRLPGAVAHHAQHLGPQAQGLVGRRVEVQCLLDLRERVLELERVAKPLGGREVTVVHDTVELLRDLSFVLGFPKSFVRCALLIARPLRGGLSRRLLRLRLALAGRSEEQCDDEREERQSEQAAFLRHLMPLAV